MTPVIVAGRRSGDPERDRLWDYCAARWQTLLGWPVFEGHHGGLEAPDETGPFCLSVASNRAVAAATQLQPEWDVALYVGADWIANTADQVERAAECALECDMLVFAHTETAVLSPGLTYEILREDVMHSCRIPTHAGEGGSWHTNTFSGVLAFPRTVWEDVGGFDERFVGWGGDDLAFYSACCALRFLPGHSPGVDRIPGSIAHLWHPSSRDDREDAPSYPANSVLMQRYLEKRWQRAEMMALLSEPGGPLGARA